MSTQIMVTMVTTKASVTAILMGGCRVTAGKETSKPEANLHKQGCTLLGEPVERRFSCTFLSTGTQQTTGCNKHLTLVLSL